MYLCIEMRKTNSGANMDTKLLQEIEKGTKSALNKKKIINYYIQNGTSTITDLSKVLDFSIPTVSKLIGEMVEDGYIEDNGKLETSGGRYPNLYGLNPKSGFFVGVDMKQFEINIGMINFKGELVAQEEVPYNMENTPENLDELCNIIVSFIDKQDIDKDKVLNININISGRVNPESGYSYSIFYFEERPLSEVISQKIDYKVTIDNDTRAMTYGEYLTGSVESEKNILFVNISWGLAIGIIIDGKVYSGKSGFAGEFGHIHAFDNEMLCHCGKKGCLETEASGSAMHRHLLKEVKNGTSSILSDKVLANETVTLSNIIEAINKEDVLCIDLVEEVGLQLGKHIAGLINIFNPDMVVIGGTVSLTGDYILQPIRTAIRKYSLNLVNKDSKVVLSKLKGSSGMIGACLIARTRLFED